MHQVHRASRTDYICTWKREPIELLKSNYTIFRTTCEQKIVGNRERLFFLAGVGWKGKSGCLPYSFSPRNLLKNAVEDSNLYQMD